MSDDYRPPVEISDRVFAGAGGLLVGGAVGIVAGPVVAIIFGAAGLLAGAATGSFDKAIEGMAAGADADSSDY